MIGATVKPILCMPQGSNRELLMHGSPTAAVPVSGDGGRCMSCDDAAAHIVHGCALPYTEIIHALFWSMLLRFLFSNASFFNRCVMGPTDQEHLNVTQH